MVGDVYQDTRRLVPGALFVARRGQKVDGRALVPEALGRGAVAVLAAEEIDGVPTLVVPDVERAVGPVAHEVYGRPFERLAALGVTGTNGKTTTVNLVRQLLEALGERAASLGTLGITFGGRTVPGAHTTPEADDLARAGRDLVAEGATHVAMEVSSHALALGRVLGVHFRVAAFTNLTHDHLDFHGTIHAYGEAKARLFTELRPDVSVFHTGDPFGRGLVARASGRVVTVATGDPRATLSAHDVVLDERGIRCVVRGPDGEAGLSSALVGAHNLENLLVALGIALGLGVDLERATEALGRACSVPGRLERVSGEEDDVLVLVDYAHTPDALARALAAVRRVSPGRLTCVFGCGGDRDPVKRAPMGRAAALGADVLFITNDNPRTEDPTRIAQAVALGVEEAGQPYVIELDRARAIERAVVGAAPGDVVLVAGKGHEPYQIVGTETRAFDDRDEGRRALALRRAR